MDPMPITAAILAGGLGLRLRPAISDRPKVLAPAAGRLFLDYVLAYLAGEGLRRVVICLGYHGEQVKAFAGDGSRWGVDIEFSQEPVALGTAGALRLAAELMDGEFFALNGDTLFLADLQALWQAHTEAGGEATLALLPVEDGQARGCVTLDSTGKITAFDEKPSTAGPALVSGGLYVLTQAALAALQPLQTASIEREVFPRLAAAGRLAGQVQEAYFADIGTPESLERFERDMHAGLVTVGRK